MAVRHKIRLYSPQGVMQAEFDAWRSLDVVKRINSFHTHVMTMDRSLDDRWQLFQTDSLVELLRSDLERNIGWYREYIGFHRTPQRILTEQGTRTFVSYGRSVDDLLDRRSILYYADTSYTDKTGPADDVAKAFVRENAGSLANSGARHRQGMWANFVVGDNVSAAATWKGQRSYRNLLQVLQEIAASRGFDFQVTLTGFSPPTFLFSTHIRQLGTDRTQTNPPIIFGAEFGNIRSLDYTQSRTEEATVAIVAGTGQKGARIVRVVEGVAKVDSPWNDREVVRDARNEDTTSALDAIANNMLISAGAQESFKVVPLQTPQYAYGRDYFFGDKVFVRDDNIVRTKKVVGVHVSSGGNEGGQSGEQLEIEFGDNISIAMINESDIIKNLVNKMQEIATSGDI